MKKRGAVFLLAAALFLAKPLALAETITLYTPTEHAAGLSFEAENVQYYHVSSEFRPQYKDEREPMFRWMERGAEAESTIMVCMPQGQVLGNLYRTEMGVSISAQQLLALWPDIAYGLARNALYVNEGLDCASVENRDGVDWLHIETLVVLDGEKMLSMSLEGLINCDDGYMKEIWIAAPSEATYLYDEQAGKALAADRKSAKAWLETVRLIPPGEKID